MTNIQNCRLTGSPLEVVLDLGQQPLGNGFVTSIHSQEYFYPLQCGFSQKSLLFQLVFQPEPGLMFHDDYAFFSGTSRGMSAHFEKFADDQFTKGHAFPDSFVVEIGSNDGILLQHFAKRGVRHLGVEPSGGVAEVAESQGISVLREFFDPQVAARVLAEEGPADLIIAANVLCHIPDVSGLAQAIELLLKPNGVLVFEDPYLGDVIRLGSYDQIYDEHVFLFSALSVSEIFNTVGMEIIDVQHQVTHGGSMRYTLAKTGMHKPTSAVDELIASELEQGLNVIGTYKDFANRMAESADHLRNTLGELAGQGRRVVAYGATSKSTTIYNYAGIGPDLINCIYDNTESKIGKLTPGTHIPIVKEAAFLDDFPDVTFLAAWNHEQEILARNHVYLENGGRWLTHVPNVRFL